MLSSYRKYDAVLVICQNNQQKRVEIAGVNDKAQEVLGRTAQELSGSLLTDILEHRMVERIEDDLEYGELEDDLGDIFARVHSLKVKNASGQMQEFRLRMVRSEAIERNPVFHFVLQDEEMQRENEAFKRILHENFKGHEVLDEQTEMPNRESILKDLELVKHYKEKKSFGAAFAVVHIDGGAVLSDRIGSGELHQMLRHIGQVCRQQLRKDDQIGLISGLSLGVILMDITPESCRIVLNRLRMAVSAVPVTMASDEKCDISVSICFHMINQLAPDDIMVSCEEKLRVADACAESVILEVA